MGLHFPDPGRQTNVSSDPLPVPGTVRSGNIQVMLGVVVQGRPHGGMGASAPCCFRSRSFESGFLLLGVQRAWRPPHAYLTDRASPLPPASLPIRGGPAASSPPQGGLCLSFPPFLGFLAHIYSSLLRRSPPVLPGSLWLLKASSRPWPAGSLAGAGNGGHVYSGSSPRRPKRSPEESRNGLVSPLCLGSQGPALGPPLSFSPGSFVLFQSLFHVVALFFPFFLFNSPFNIFFDCSEGEGVGGEAGLSGETRTWSKLKVKRSLFWSLSPPALPVPGQQALLLWEQQGLGVLSLEVSVPLSWLALFHHPYLSLPS